MFPEAEQVPVRLPPGRGPVASGQVGEFLTGVEKGLEPADATFDFLEQVGTPELGEGVLQSLRLKEEVGSGF